MKYYTYERHDWGSNLIEVDDLNWAKWFDDHGVQRGFHTIAAQAINHRTWVARTIFTGLSDHEPPMPFKTFVEGREDVAPYFSRTYRAACKAHSHMCALMDECVREEEIKKEIVPIVEFLDKRLEKRA